MSTEDNIHFSDRVADAMRKAATELEEFRVQAALGKAEAKDKYEEVKKKFDLFLHDTRYKMHEGKEKIKELQPYFDELKVQLALGKADTVDVFNAQKKKILQKIREIEVKIKSNKTLNKVYATLLIEIEKFKVQLEWLEEKFKDGTKNIGESFEKGKEDFKNTIQSIKEKFSKPEESRWEHFQDEISTAFSHFKSAFVKP